MAYLLELDNGMAYEENKVRVAGFSETLVGAVELAGRILHSNVALQRLVGYWDYGMYISIYEVAPDSMELHYKQDVHL